MLILRRSNCISTASGIVTVCRWLFSTQVLCSSSGQIVLVQHPVSSLSLGDCSQHRLRAESCNGNILPLLSICYFLINRLMFFNIIVMFAFCYVCLLSILCILCSCIIFIYFFVYFSLLVLSCLFPIFLQVYWPLPPGGNPTAVNKISSSSRFFSSPNRPHRFCGIMHRRCCRPVAGNIVGALYHKL